MELNGLSVISQVKQFLSDQLAANESIIEICNAKLYFAQTDEKFVYSNLDGFLCLVTNRKIKCLYLRLINAMNYTKIFEIELYKEISKGYSALHDNFHAIEFPFGHLGISFCNKTDGDRFKSSILYMTYVLADSDPKTCCFVKSSSPDKKLKSAVDESSSAAAILNKKLQAFDFDNFKFNKIETAVSFEINFHKKELKFKVSPELYPNDELLTSHYNMLKLNYFGKDKFQENVKKLLEKDKNNTKLPYHEVDPSKRKTIQINRENIDSMTTRSRGMEDRESPVSRLSIHQPANSNSNFDHHKSLKHVSHVKSRMSTLNTSAEDSGSGFNFKKIPPKQDDKKNQIQRYSKNELLNQAMKQRNQYINKNNIVNDEEEEEDFD